MRENTASHCGSGSSEEGILKGNFTQKLKCFCFRLSGEKTEFGARCQQLLPVVEAQSHGVP